MLDNLKIRTFDQKIINRLSELKGFEPYQHRNNNFIGFCKYGKLMRLDFRKCFDNGIIAGFHYLDISISPHYHFNNYLHNGNDLTPQNCIKIISNILNYLNMESQDFDLFKVVNIEFGLNIIPETDVKNLIDNLLFYRRTKFIIPNKKTPYFKITNATKNKLLKTYAKGLQFIDLPKYGIDPNTFRFEVKSKKSCNIKKYGIDLLTDLFKIETYQSLEQEIINEWQNVLIINTTPYFSELKTDEVQFVKSANKIEFWDDLKGETNRNKLSRYKEKYYRILKGKNNLHTQIKGQIIDKFLSWSSGADLPQETPINKGKHHKEKHRPKEINGQSAPPNQNRRVCLVTGLDISAQRQGSKFIREKTIKMIKETDPEIYHKLGKKYLTEKAKKLSEEKQIYLICKNIRDQDSNPRNNRQRFEQRNYPKHQLQFSFVP